MIIRDNKGRFVKGTPSLNKGRKYKCKSYNLSENGRLQKIKNLGTGMLGKKQSEFHKKRMKEVHTGKIISKEQRKQISEKLKNRPKSKEFKENLKRYFSTKKGMEQIRINGIKTSKRMKGNQYRKGLKPWNYIDGRSKLLGPARYGDDWDKIRYLVYLRDRFTCQDCGVNKKKLDVHHITPFLVSFDNSLNNLISLCKSCHRQEEVRIMKELKKQGVIIR